MGHITRMLDVVSVGFTTGEAAVDIDTQGAEGVLLFGVVASTAARIPSLSLKSGASTTGLVACASTFTNTSTAAGQIVICTDVYRPGKRYLQATLATSSATPSWLICCKYNTRTSIGNFTASGTNMGTANGGVKRVVSPSSAT